MKWLSYDGPLYQICIWIYRFLGMSMSLVICCIPVLTVPAAIAATFGIARSYVRGESSSFLLTFRSLFVENFKQSMICGWIWISVVVLIALDYRIVTSVHTTLYALIHVVLWFVTILCLCVGLNLFSLMVHMRMGNRQLFLSAFMLSFYKPHLTLLNLLMLFTMLEIVVRFPITVFIVFPGAATFVTYWFSNRKFKGLENQASAPSYVTVHPTEM